MALPAFDANGLLPAGIHVVGGIDALSIAMCGTPRRKVLVSELRRLVKEKLGFVAHGLDLYIGGSFTTDKLQPDDLDICISLPLADVQSRGALISLVGSEGRKGKIRDDYRVELTLQIAGFDERNVLEYFTYLGEKEAIRRNLPPRLIRGLIKVESWERG